MTCELTSSPTFAAAPPPPPAAEPHDVLLPNTALMLPFAQDPQGVFTGSDAMLEELHSKIRIGQGRQ